MKIRKFHIIVIRIYYFIIHMIISFCVSLILSIIYYIKDRERYAYAKEKMRKLLSTDNIYYAVEYIYGVKSGVRYISDPLFGVIDFSIVPPFMHLFYYKNGDDCDTFSRMYYYWAKTKKYKSYIYFITSTNSLINFFADAHIFTIVKDDKNERIYVCNYNVRELPYVYDINKLSTEKIYELVKIDSGSFVNPLIVRLL